MKNIRSISYSHNLSTPLDQTHVDIDVDRIVLVEGPRSTWRSVHGGYQFYATAKIYTEVPGLDYTIVVNGDNETFTTQQFNSLRDPYDPAPTTRFIPKCETYLKDILDGLKAQWKDQA